ncbi:MAG: hypothetical protein H8D56_08210 [Planctomycetes bacterium]|nr:hypothetical protein [Planctomycetota bacterium]MBL7144271.1 hypothetical protein [Phycisphaerae bacterium]
MSIRRIASDGWAKKALFYLLAALLGGCVPVMSLHPLYTEKDVVFEERLLGRWVDDPNRPETAWEFHRIEEPNNAYSLVFSDEEGKKGSFVAHLVRLQNKLFLDVYPSEPPWEIEDPNKLELPYNSFFLIPAHTFIKIDFNGPQLKMWLTKDEEMEKLLKEEPNAVKHTFIEDKLILTAPTKELQSFVIKYADDKRVFKGEIVLDRKKN